MVTKQEILTAVSAEAAEVKARVDELEAQVLARQDGASSADMAEILAAVQGIFTPIPPAPPGTDLTNPRVDANGNKYDASGNIVDAVGTVLFSVGAFSLDARGNAVNADGSSIFS